MSKETWDWKYEWKSFFFPPNEKLVIRKININAKANVKLLLFKISLNTGYLEMI